MTYFTAGDVLNTYPTTAAFWFDLHYLAEGELKVLVVLREDGEYDVWNNHPLRKGWQLVYALEKCNPEQQVKESLASLKRLFEG